MLCQFPLVKEPGRGDNRFWEVRFPDLRMAGNGLVNLIADWPGTQNDLGEEKSFLVVGHIAFEQVS